MTDHSRRIREHLRVEAEALRLEAERARLFDHRGNRGSEAEQGLLRWLRARLAPHYTVSSGEVIDSFDTNADTPSRQQDGIVHRNDMNANRFVLPSGLRLVPVESVAALVEVKLTLTSTEFSKTDVAASQTSALRVRTKKSPLVPRIPIVTHHDYEQHGFHSILGDPGVNGVPLCDPSLATNRTTFAVFAFGGLERREALLGMLRDATTINLVCCLGAGCVARAPDGSFHAVASEDALAMFADRLSRSAIRHSVVSEHLGVAFDGYAGFVPEHVPA